MVPGNYKILTIVCQSATAAETTVSGYVDTLGYDYLCLNCNHVVSAAASPLTSLRVREDDTVPTAFTDMSAIVRLCGAAATSTSAGFVIPTANSVVNNVEQFNIDLRGRKRYIGVDLVPTVSGIVNVNALLLRGHVGKDQAVSVDATLTTTVAQLRLNESC